MCVWCEKERMGPGRKRCKANKRYGKWCAIYYISCSRVWAIGKSLLTERVVSMESEMPRIQMCMRSVIKMCDKFVKYCLKHCLNALITLMSKLSRAFRLKMICVARNLSPGNIATVYCSNSSSTTNQPTNQFIITRMQTICSKTISAFTVFEALHHRNRSPKLSSVSSRCLTILISSPLQICTQHTFVYTYRLVCVCSCDEHHSKVWTFPVCLQVRCQREYAGDEIIVGDEIVDGWLL